jgi:DNA-binding transcriptional LysR family regulator
LWRQTRIQESLISLGPDELICQRFQEALSKRGVSWLPKVEMDSLELIQNYVEAGYGFGLSVRLPGKKLSSKVNALELPDFPPVKLGVLYRTDLNPEHKVRHIFLEQVKKQAVRLQLG